MGRNVVSSLNVHSRPSTSEFVTVFQQGDIDIVSYVEAYMEVLTALGDAENDLYSANFADYSGGGGTKVRGTSLNRLFLCA